MKEHNNFLRKSGFSLVELLVAVALVMGVFAIIFPQYISITKHSSVTRKIVKTQADAYANLEQMFKDIASAGFGLPAVPYNLPAGATSCLRTAGKALEITPKDNASMIIVRSTAAGDKKKAGAWGVVSVESNTITLSYSSMKFERDDYLMVLDTASRSYKKLGLLKFESDYNLSLKEQYSSLNNLHGKMAYWIPNTSQVCYKTSFSLEDYGGTDPKPDMCASGTKKLMRSKDPPEGFSGSAPVMDCVHNQGLGFLIGCVDSGSGILWSKDSCPSSTTPRLLQVGVVVQAGPKEKNKISPEYLTLFSPSDIKLNDDERYYRWLVIRKTIFLMNIEREE